jgi:hypothetical protein
VTRGLEYARVIVGLLYVSQIIKAKYVVFPNGNWDNFSYNFIRYKVFLLATYITVLLHRRIHAKAFVGEESRLPWTRVTIKQDFCPA